MADGTIKWVKSRGKVASFDQVNALHLKEMAKRYGYGVDDVHGGEIIFDTIALLRKMNCNNINVILKAELHKI